MNHLHYENFPSAHAPRPVRAQPCALGEEQDPSPAYNPKYPQEAKRLHATLMLELRSFPVDVRTVPQ